MALDDARDRVDVDPASLEQAASQVGAMVADRVRTALETAERAAADVRRRALDRASADRDALHGTAALVTARIDLIEAEVGHLLQELREEVALIVTEADRAADAALHDEVPEPQPEPAPAPAADEPPALETVADETVADETVAEDSDQAESEDDHGAGAEQGEPSQPSAQGRSGGLFRRRSRPRTCGVCGRSAQAADADAEGWHQASGTNLCRDCQAAGWRLPQNGKVPYRSAGPQATSRS